MPTSSRIASFEEDYAHSEIMMQELGRELRITENISYRPYDSN